MRTFPLYRTDANLAAIQGACTYDSAVSNVELAIRAAKDHRHHNNWLADNGRDHVDFDFDALIDSLKDMRALMPGNHDYMAAPVWRDWLVEMVLPLRKLVAQSLANNGKAA